MLSVSTTRRARRGMLREWRLHALSVFSLIVAFVCLGAAILALTNLRAIENRWAHAGRASIYLKEGASADEVDALRAAVILVPGVTGARYVSSGDARIQFGGEIDRHSPLASLPAEAFPASIELDIGADMPEADLTAMIGKLKQLQSVDEIETYQSWTEKLSRLVSGGVAAAALLAAVVFAGVLAVVGSTMRLVLQRRRVEVEVLKLVGATDAFVRNPFVIEGCVQGALGATGAIGLLATLFVVVRGRLDEDLAALVGVQPSFLPWQVAVGMVLVGAGLGAAASLASLRKLVTV